MGAVESTAVLKSHEGKILRFVGSETIPLTDPFWDDLLSFSYPLTKIKPADLDYLSNGWYRCLSENNDITSHLPKLLVHLGKAIEEPIEPKAIPVRAINAVCFVHLFMKQLSQHCEFNDFYKYMHLNISEEEGNALGIAPGSLDVAAFVTRSLLRFIAYSDVNAYSYVLHVEVMSLLIVLSSSQLHSSPMVSGPHNHLFLDVIMSQIDLSGAVVRKLLISFTARLPLPTRAPLYVPSSNPSSSRPSGSQEPQSLSDQQQQHPEQTGGVLRKVGSAAAAVLLLPYYTFTYLISPSTSKLAPSPLADHALMLLLLLLNQTQTLPKELPHEIDASNASGGGAIDALSSVQNSEEEDRNPFRTALTQVKDEQMALRESELPPGDAPVSNGDKQVVSYPPISKSSIHVPFAPLFDTLTSCLSDERCTLLLYSLVHSNPTFLDYVLVRADLDTLLLPILELLYNAPEHTANHVYMLLILMLILSQDAAFNANVHKIILPSVPWYKERLLARTSLGSLMLLVLIRTVKYNLATLRDVYLHTNCLATLANMAPHSHHLTAYAAQRLVSLFQMLAKKYTRLTASHSTASGMDASSSGHVGSPAYSELEKEESETSELHIYTDFLRIVLEIINAILSYSLPRNPEVVYALLHRQEIFVPFRNNPLFYELLENVFTVIEFFNARMEDVTSRRGELSVEKVLEVILENGRTWRGDTLKMFPELRFTYEEELHPEDFFLPYVWTLIVATSGVPWDKERICLYSAQSTEQLQDVFDHEAFDASSEVASTPREEV